MQIRPGRSYPLGATYDGAGTNFALFSEVATKVELCLFDDEGVETRHELPDVTAFVWHGYLPNVPDGTRYGFRVHGPDDPGAGHRCNPSKLLLDPYSKAVEGDIDWNESMYGHRLSDPDGPANDDDSGPSAQRSVVVSPYFDWDDDRPPRTPWHETVVYEVHVKGFTACHPSVPEELRGTYAGLATPEAVDHLTRLGVTAVELLPVHEFTQDHRLVEKGLRNYWGYNSICYLAPHHEYAATGTRGQQVQEFKRMVRTLHDAGIEVILDVVYNHTAEGNHLGPTLSFKGIDNAAYYRLAPGDRRRYTDYTGTGNTLNTRHPNALQLLMDSLRYWVTEMHVDGFRFDLASTLARELHAFDRLSAFFDLIQQDPVVSQVKLIAEPWDVGEGGYQVGGFPAQWSEWNGKYRDTVRDYWRGQPATLGEFALRFTGSSDIYEPTGRRPDASINFVTAHDGFTLHDLVSFNEKHNEANAEGNRDGESHNRSWNCGVEGATDDDEVLELRARQRRNILATLLLSQGVPMLLGGDELGRTQHGNNNGYCQDNEVSWYDWQGADLALLEWTRWLLHLRKEHPTFRRRQWFEGRPSGGTADIGWFSPGGSEMSEQDWVAGFAKSLGVFLNGDAISGRHDGGDPVTDHSFCVLFNAHHEPLDFRLPQQWGERWSIVMDTAERLPPAPDADHRSVESGDPFEVSSRSLVLLRRLA